MNGSLTEILSIRSQADFDRAVDQAVSLLQQGQTVVLPTETVYGLAANAFSPAAVRRIFEIKRRPFSNPLIVHFTGQDMLDNCVRRWSPEAEQLGRAFWPGPLTLIALRSPQIPEVVTAGGDTVALRWPSHSFMQAVIQKCGFPLAAPSANLANRLSPTRAEHVKEQLDGTVPLIVDTGSAPVGIESTVVDLVSRPPVLLRPGMISFPKLKTFVKNLERSTATESSSVARSPGRTTKHYAPRAKLIIGSWKDSCELEAFVRKFPYSRNAIGIVSYSVKCDPAGFAHCSLLPPEAENYASSLFSELHACDAAGSDLILVESPPPDAAWDGIRDRLTRASSTTGFELKDTERIDGRTRR